MSKDAAKLLACCLRLAKPDELCETIKDMIDRSERESYLLGLRLILTMATSAAGRTTLWSEVHLLERAIHIGVETYELRASRFDSIYIDEDPLLLNLEDGSGNDRSSTEEKVCRASGSTKATQTKTKYSQDLENAHDLLTFKRVSKTKLDKISMSLFYPCRQYSSPRNNS